MKNIKILSLIAFLAVIFFMAGCAKPDDPTPINPVITVTGIPTSPIAYGDSVSFSWSIKNWENYGTLNGVPIGQTGTYSTGRLLADTKYKFFAVGLNGGTDTVSFTIKVGDWTSSQYGLVSYDYWMLDSIGDKRDGSNTYIWDNNTNHDLLMNQDYYQPDGKFVVKRNGNIISSGLNWDLDSSDSLALIDPSTGNQSKFYLFSVTETKLVLVQKTYGTDMGTGENFSQTTKFIYKRNK